MLVGNNIKENIAKLFQLYVSNKNSIRLLSNTALKDLEIL